MSYEFYKIIHITGLILVFSGLTSILTLKMAGVDLTKNLRRLGMISHGVGLVLILISGFGLAARLGMVRGLPNWVYAKLAVWFLLGAALTIAKRKGHIGWPVFILITGLGVTAATLAITKPF